MIEDLKPYPEYKESGQEWLGQVPGHWTIRRLKTVLREKDARSADGSGLLLSLTRNRGLIARSDMTDKVHSARTLVGYKLYAPTEIVMNRMQAWSGMFGAGRCAGLVSPDYAVFKLLGDDHVGFILNRLKSPDMVRQFALESKGIGSGFNRLYSDKFCAISAAFPPPAEQAAIVRFLDHWSGRLEKVIRAKRRVIALLKEQKQAIIHRAVTRGLDTNVKLKDSGIPWLGEIPEHWEVMQLRQVLSFGPKNGVSPHAATGVGVLSFSISAVRDGRINISGNEKIVELDRARVAGFCIHKGDILLVRGNGNVALVGKCGLVDFCPDDCVYPDILMKLRPNEKMNAHFMVLAINSAYVTNQVSTLAKTSNGAFKVSGATVRSIAMVVPPFAEQVSLVERIETETATVITAISRLEREIELLREYRTRLVADVVTGKLDVRAAAADLPELEEDAAGGGDAVEEEIEVEEEVEA